MKRAFGWLALVAGMSLTGVATSQDPKSKDSKDATRRDFDDRDFVLKAASSGMHEIALGKLALKRSSDEKVKAFAERMVRDHGKANEKLNLAATELGIQIGEKSVTPDHQKHIEHVREMKGENFDREYIRHMVKDHEEDVALFRRASAEAKVKAVAAFAKDTLPALQEHLKLAKELQSSSGTKAEPKSPPKSDR